MKIKQNDEWDYADALGHYPLVRRLGHRLLGCHPPYVVGISGSWGAGKTSFLRKLWVYLGAKIEWDGGKVQSLDEACKRQDWFQEEGKEFTDRIRGRTIELVWFNPWQHQFEASPLVALLQEIRQHFSMKRRLFNETGKLTDVALHSTLNSMQEIAKTLQIPLPSAKTVMERGREYEAEHFSTQLSSQAFRDFFEAAIEVVTGKEGLLVIFIDDLDRCEGDVSYRLLEALKLYLNARNCVYVLGIDQTHLENSIARTLSGEKETWRYRPLARDYLNKMFQATFLLPVPRDAVGYIEKLLDRDDGNFRDSLANLFGIVTGPTSQFVSPAWDQLVQTLDRNLPHNPRKLKCFVASWKTYLDVLDPPALSALKLDWRLTLILQYFAQFEEPLYRRVEQFPDFYNQHILPFCQGRQTKPHPLFDGLEIPSDDPSGSADGTGANESGSLGSGSGTLLGGATSSDASGSPTIPEPRFFWVSRLVNDLARTQVTIDQDAIRRHLPQAKG
jgi:hypothetical protein